MRVPVLRNAAVIAVAMLLALEPVCAAVTAYPSFYRARGADYYENLRATKLAWLRANAASLASEMASDRVTLAASRGVVRRQMKAVIDRLAKRAADLDVEIAVMVARRDPRQEALLKRNVEAWIGAARRGGDGAVALRLMHDLAGAGL